MSLYKFSFILFKKSESSENYRIMGFQYNQKYFLDAVCHSIFAVYKAFIKAGVFMK